MTVVASLGNAFLYTCLLYLLTGALPTFRKSMGVGSVASSSIATFMILSCPSIMLVKRFTFIKFIKSL